MKRNPKSTTWKIETLTDFRNPLPKLKTHGGETKGSSSDNKTRDSSNSRIGGGENF